MKLLTIGGATYDILIQYPDADMLARTNETGSHNFLLLEEGKKADVESVVYKTGGGATNSAVSFARLGFQVEAFFKIGDDYQGSYILDVLSQEKVATTHIQKTRLLPTSVSFIVSCPSGDRSLLVYRGASRLLQEQELPITEIQSSDCVYVTSLSGSAMKLLPIIAQLAKKSGRTIAVNPGSSQLKAGAHILRAALPNINILILNTSEATLLMHSYLQENALTQHTPMPVLSSTAPRLLQQKLLYEQYSFSLYDFFAAVMSNGPHTVVVTNGSEGVYVAHNNTILFHPSIPTAVVSTLGAGDAFGSCFVASLVAGYNVEDATRRGVLNSASVLGHLDAKTGLLTKNELDHQLTQLDKSLLQNFLF